MIFDNLEDFLSLKIFPLEIWLLIKKFYIQYYLLENLYFPVILPRRINHELFADYWQGYMKYHRWDIEIGNIAQCSLVSHYFMGKRISIEWSGINLQMRERVFGVGFNINQLFLESIFLDEDYLELLPSIELSEDENDFEYDLFD